MPSRYILSDANPIPGPGKDAAHPDIAFCQFGFVDVLAVGLGDDHHIGHLHNAALDALQFVARTGDLEHHEHIDHRMYGRFGLSHADRFDEDDVESGSFAQDDRFAGFAGYAAERPAEGRGG